MRKTTIFGCLEAVELGIFQVSHIMKSEKQKIGSVYLEPIRFCKYFGSKPEPDKIKPWIKDPVEGEV